MPVNSTHPGYDATLPAWLRARDVVAGEDAVKAAGEKYLPRLDSQSAEEYRDYKTRGSFFNAAARTAEGFVGLIFRRDPVVRVPSAGDTLSTALTKCVEDQGTDPRTCQWKLKGTNLPGATGKSFTKSSAQTTDAGSYTVVVSNTFSFATSAIAVLTVMLPALPQILGLSGAPSGDVILNWSTVSRRTYRMQFKGSLTEINWSSLTPDLLATGITSSVVNRPNGAARRFYRVLLLP